MRLTGRTGAILAVGFTAAAQLVGCFGGLEPGFHFDRPYFVDQFYYAGLARSTLSGFPPQNPAYAGVALTQHAFHLAPVGLLAPFIGPYAAMRVMTVVWSAVMVLLLRRYQPTCYGAVALAILGASPVFTTLTPLSIDLASRGFHHLPAVVLALIAIHETRFRVLRVAAAVGLPLAHLLLAIGLGPAVMWSLWRRDRATAGVFVVSGLLVATLSQSGSYGDAFGGVRLALGFFPVEPLLHLAPLALCFFVTRPATWVVGAIGAFVLSATIAWNRFYYLFGLDFALAGVVGRAVTAERLAHRRLAWILLLISVAAFGVRVGRNMVEKPPFDGAQHDRALAWIDENTPADACFLTAPYALPWCADPTWFRERGWGSWVLAHRNLFVGFYGWATDVGLPGLKRSVDVHEYLSGRAPRPAAVGYVYFGPMERVMYERFADPELVEAFRDEHVTIWRVP